MELSDWIGFAGVTILLVAFLLNLLKKITENSYAYLGMNAFGAALTCLASIMINYVPFIILEAIWTLVSLVSMFRLMVIKK